MQDVYQSMHPDRVCMCVLGQEGEDSGGWGAAQERCRTFHLGQRRAVGQHKDHPQQAAVGPGLGVPLELLQ